MKSLLKRIGVYYLLFLGAAMLSTLYYSFLYLGPDDQEHMNVFLLAWIMVIFVIKYIVYELVSRFIFKKSAAIKPLKTIYNFALVAAFIIDFYAIFAGLQPVTDNLFFLIGLVVSPLVLLLANISMLIVLLLQRKVKRQV